MAACGIVPRAIVGLLLAILFLWAGAFGFADLAAMRGDGVVARHERGERLSDSDWSSGYRAYLTAASLQPFSGGYSEKLGRLLELRAASDARQGVSARDLRLAALDHFRTAATKRPTWPFSRVAIARLKAKLGRIDAEFVRNLIAASELAPAVPGVQEPLMDLGLIAWPLLDEPARAWVLGIVERNLHFNPRRTIRQAVAHHRFGLIEVRIGADPALQRLYREIVGSHPVQ